MSELVEFIRGCLDADEQTARAATPGPWQAHTGRNRMASITVGEEVWVGDIDYDPDAAHVARHDPARVLAEVNAKRAILDLHQPSNDSERVGWAFVMDGDGFEHYYTPCDLCGPTKAPEEWPCDTVRLLAQPFRGEPGWRDEWGTQ